MNKKNKNLIGILVIIIILLVGLFKVNFHKSTSILTISTKVSNNQNKEPVKLSGDLNYDNFSFKSTIKNKTDKNINILEIKAQVDLKFIETTNYYFERKFPNKLIARFDSDVKYDCKADFQKNAYNGQLANTGYLEIKGTKTFIGFISKEDARKSILKDTYKEIRKNVQKEIEKQVKEIQE